MSFRRAVRLAACLTAVVALPRGTAFAAPPGLPVGGPANLLNAVAAADYLVELQNDWGAIPEYPSAGYAAWDSHMQYAMWGLAATYRHVPDPRYLNAMRAGLSWLADRQRADGSWWIGYVSKPPFTPLQGAYGVSASIGLFIHDLWLYGSLSGDAAFIESMLPKVRLGLGFLYSHMRASDGTFRSSWIRQSDGSYAKSMYRYTSDQIDMYLGLRAAGLLLQDVRYTNDAATVRSAVAGTRFFLKNRYAVALKPDGTKDTYVSLLTVWPQGYVPWVIGRSDRTERSVAWLDGRQRKSGAVIFRSGASPFTLAAEVLVGGHVGLGTPGSPPATLSAEWLKKRQDQATGGVRNAPDQPQKYCHITAFAAMVWLAERPIVPS